MRSYAAGNNITLTLWHTCETVPAPAVALVVLGHAVRALRAGHGLADFHAGLLAVALGPAGLRGVAVVVRGAAAGRLAASGQLVLDLSCGAGADRESALVQHALLALGARHDLAGVEAGAPAVDVHLEGTQY